MVNHRSPTAPLGSLPANSALPKTAHELADEWRAADARLDQLNRDEAEARAAVDRAKLEDAELLKAAVLAGKPIPAEAEQENAAKAALADLERRGPILLAERDRIGKELARLLRSDENRHHVADRARAAIEPAVTAYRDALDKAEKAVRKAHTDLTAATVLLSFVDKVDSSHGIHPTPYRIAGLPDFATARRHLAELDTRLAGLDERSRPAQRVFRRPDGRVLTMPRDMAADAVRDGDVAEWLDGFPAEAPSAHPSALRGADHHLSAATTFKPRSVQR